MKVSIIYNPSATGFNKSVLIEAYNIFYNQGASVKLCESKRSKDVIELVKRENETSDIIVSLGGDGTLGEVFIAFGETIQKASYIHIPTGTANDSADNLELYKGKPKASLQLYRNLNSCDEVDVDMVTANDTPFAYVSCAGAFSDLTYRTPKVLKKVLGKAGYYTFVGLNVPTCIPDLIHKPLKITYQKDDRLITTEALTMIVSNSKTFGGFNLFKDAEITDGIFEVSILKNFPFKHLPPFAYQLFYKGGENFDITKYPEYIDTFRTDYFKAIILNENPNIAFNHDGDKADVKLNNRQVEYKCQGKIKMLLPQRAK